MIHINIQYFVGLVRDRENLLLANANTKVYNEYYKSNATSLSVFFSLYYAFHTSSLGK